MIYLTGDTHAYLDIDKLYEENFSDYSKLTKDDYVIILGDFGLIWDNNLTELSWRKWLDKCPWTTLFVDGNHENFNLLNDFPYEEKFGGKVQKINNSIYHLCRGQVYEIEGKKFFTMGGATSIDKERREIGISWWPQELPNYTEYEEAMSNLDKNNWEVDYVLTHCAPSSLLPHLYADYYIDSLVCFFDQIRETLKFKKWFFGHYHIDKQILNFYALYQKIYKLEEE